MAECAEKYGAAGRVLVVAKGAVLNVTAGRYLPPEVVTAAGGYVVRESDGGIELLLIQRRGAWDLPKGKLDPGESPEAGALREVSEEIGVPVEQLTLGSALGTTVHGYPHPKRSTYAVKTTHWFALTCTADRFVPQASEDITAVEWMPWDEAGLMLGFETLRQHHATVDVQKRGPLR
jgi:8-oxo-dGTP pyrophosphatase MutT (NUDIX family)